MDRGTPIVGKLLGVTRCVNPAHNDSDPSMAVYDHGKDKYQVFCFGCKHHGWVSPDEVDLAISLPSPKRDYTYLTVNEDQTEPIIKFFLDRNFQELNIPWGSIDMGVELQEQSDNPHAMKYKICSRPYMEWDLYNYRFNSMGRQRRYLDNRKPKTRYFPGGNGNYAEVAYIDLGDPGARALHICESWIDAHWVDIYQADKCDEVMTILGTQSNKIDTHLYNWSKKYRQIHLWFDGDLPGIDCSHDLFRKICEFDSSVYNHTNHGKKVYELGVRL